MGLVGNDVLGGLRCLLAPRRH